MPPIHMMLKPVSGQCNLRCSYCFYADEMSKRCQSSFGRMTTETLEKVIKKAMACAEGACTIAFQGGEPTLAGLDFYRQCVELQQRYNTGGVAVYNALQTNGMLLDEEWCAFLARHHFLVGLSVDGIQATHDAFRRGPDGKGTWLSVLEAARRLREAGAEFNVLTVVNQRTAPRIQKIYSQYAKLGFSWQQYIVCLDPMGEKPGQGPWSLSPEAYGRFLIGLFELWDTDLRSGKQPYIRQFENYIAVLTGSVPEACDQRGVCSIQYIVEADGSVYPCDFYVLDEYRLGNLHTDSLEEISKRREAVSFLETSKVHVEKCRACSYYQICRGGCRRHREVVEGRLGENYYCEGYRMFFDACLPRLKEIAAACNG